ncbi:MAG: HD domain-containing protein [Lachnospiraceae bacterium]|nr:HD domain-containing protein [Lachnospiraceae bacterium]
MKIQHSVIASFANMIEARDGVTGLHIKRTSAYVEIIVKELQKSPDYKGILTDEYASKIIDAAPLHDIGKISIPDDILRKQGKLTDEELDVIKTHPSMGAEIIEETLTEVEGNEYLCIARDYGTLSS